jgi:apolipoprotein N-acyltransferase
MKKPPFEPKTYLLLAACGVGLGLSAPGFGQFYLAWFGLVPLLLAAASSKGMWQALLRGFIFGLAYNLTYLNWFLNLQPLDWLNFNGWQGWLLAGTAWAFVSTLQGLIVSAFALTINKLPMTGSFFPVKIENSWRLPALITVPLAWLLITFFLGNAHDLLGVPWSMLEYSQYKQLPLIQIASIIGGVGLGYLIALTNTVIASYIATTCEKFKTDSLLAKNKRTAIVHIVVVILILAGLLVYGTLRLSTSKAEENLTVSVLQGNINIEMERTKHRYSLDELIVRYAKMLEQCPRGLIVWTENALPAYLVDQTGTMADLTSYAKRHQCDMVIGAMYHDNEHTPFNSAYGITNSGDLVNEVYSKRYLVPFGEYTPSAVRSMPEWILRLTNTPAGGGFGSGKSAVALPLACGRVAPLICFETLSPELCASSVRKGGQLLVNISDLAWFHRSMIGEQMIAFSVFRALENSRYFVFGANTGPSAIIDQNGRLKELSGQEKDLVLIGKVALSSDLTPFTHWFVF